MGQGFNVSVSEYSGLFTMTHSVSINYNGKTESGLSIHTTNCSYAKHLLTIFNKYNGADIDKNTAFEILEFAYNNTSFSTTSGESVCDGGKYYQEFKEGLELYQKPESLGGEMITVDEQYKIVKKLLKGK